MRGGIIARLAAVHLIARAEHRQVSDAARQAFSGDCELAQLIARADWKSRTFVEREGPIALSALRPHGRRRHRKNGVRIADKLLIVMVSAEGLEPSTP